MNTSLRWFLSGALIVVVSGSTWLLFAQTERGETKSRGHLLNADKIAAAAGTKATTTPDGVVRLSWPRTDVSVNVDGMPMKPFAGLDPRRRERHPLRAIVITGKRAQFLEFGDGAFCIEGNPHSSLVANSFFLFPF